MRSRSVALALLGALVAASLPSLAADFEDNDYHEVVLFQWDETSVDVLVLPPAAAEPAARLAAIRQSIAAWDSGIDALGASWVTPFEIRAYTVGIDTPPASAFQDPEILVLSAEYNPVLLLGIGISTDDLVCSSLPLGSADVRAFDGFTPDIVHRHDGSVWGVAQCRTNTENVCFVVNTNPALGSTFWDSTSQHMMYDLNAHEFGHCLGIGHVGDALDFEARNFPTEDIMSYQDTPSQVHCVSNLNLRAFEGVVAKAFGRPSSEWLDFGDYVHMSPSQYTQVTCANP